MVYTYRHVWVTVPLFGLTTVIEDIWLELHRYQVLSEWPLLSCKSLS